MTRPNDNATVSRAGSGEVADEPEQLSTIAVTDGKNAEVGMLERWGLNEWLYATVETLRWIRAVRPDSEYEDISED
jgi:hypothetical protein